MKNYKVFLLILLCLALILIGCDGGGSSSDNGGNGGGGGGEPILDTPLCFTALENTEVRFREVGSITSYTEKAKLQYSRDGKNWVDYAFGFEISLNENEKVYFSAKEKNNFFNEDDAGYILGPAAK